MVNRRGTTSTGCLFQLLAVAGLIYCGIHIGEPYLRYYRYRDGVDEQARFAALRNDDSVRKDILANADSLTMPEGAYHVQILRSAHAIRIWTSYVDHWTVWHYTRPVVFTVDITKPL